MTDELQMQLRQESTITTVNSIHSGLQEWSGLQFGDDSQRETMVTRKGRGREVAKMIISH